MELTANLEEIKDAKNRTRDEIVGFIHIISNKNEVIDNKKYELLRNELMNKFDYFIALCNRVSSW